MTPFSFAPCKAAGRPVHVAWLLAFVLAGLLAGCGGGGSSNSASQQQNPPPGPASDPAVDLRQQHLLSDAELKTSPIAAAAGLAPPSAAEQAWLAQNVRPIRSIAYDRDFSDLGFLASTLEGKRIVQLGESSHGSAEFSAMKVRLIKYLHETLGYNVIAFESSIVGCHLQDLSLDSYAPSPNSGVECIFTVWDTQDLNELASYIRATRQTAKPLRLAGFDVQKSSTFDDAAPVLNWISPILDRFAPDLTAPVRNAYITRDTSAANVAFVETLAAKFRVVVDATPLDNPDRREIVFAWLAIEFLHDNLQRASMDGPLRESMMATNITRLAELAYPQEKIIVWAHNAHISNHFQYSGAPMGSYLRSHWGNQLSSIGQYMLRGASAGNDRTPEYVKTPLADSLEAYTYSVRLAALYLPIPRSDTAGSGDDWLHRPTKSYYWGFQVQTDVLDSNYDGVIVIDHSSMPHYN